MIKYETYRLLNESLGMYSLGVTPTQSLGIQSNLPFGEAGMPPELSAKKGKKPPFGDEDPGMGGPVAGEEPPMDDMGGDMEPMGDEPDEMGDEMGGDEMGGEEEGPIDIPAKIAELEAELEKLKALVGDEEGDDLNADLDHEDDLGDLGDEEGDIEGAESDLEDAEEDDDELPFKKGKGAPFMKKGMKKEGKMVGKDDAAGPQFMMKKAKKCDDGMGKNPNSKNFDKATRRSDKTDKDKLVLGKAKKCDAGMKKYGSADDQGAMPMKKGCKKKMKEATGYERPQALDNSNDAWLKSIHQQLASTSVDQKYNDGLWNLKKEDLLLPPPNGGLEGVAPKPGEVGYAPQQAVGGDFTNEAIQDMLARIAQLEKR